jgi:hypothetical protein
VHQVDTLIESFPEVVSFVFIGFNKELDDTRVICTFCITTAPFHASREGSARRCYSSLFHISYFLRSSVSSNNKNVKQRISYRAPEGFVLFRKTVF